MKNKKWLLLLIIAFPSAFWLILESSTINSRKLPHYGPKTVLNPADTLFYKVRPSFYSMKDTTYSKSEAIDTSNFPICALLFIHPKYRNDSYRLTGLWEYLNYKKNKIEHIPFMLVNESKAGKSTSYNELLKLKESSNVHFYHWPSSSYDSLIHVYFREKPYYIDYSFFILLDGKRNIRGYYDGRYVSELKRLIDEYQHLRLKEEKNKLIQTNEIKKETN